MFEDKCRISTLLSGEPIHSTEKRRSGYFQGKSDTVKLKLSIGARRNIFLQTLLDTQLPYGKSAFCCKLLVKDRLGKIIRPRLPLQVRLYIKSRPRPVFNESNKINVTLFDIFSILNLMEEAIGPIRTANY